MKDLPKWQDCDRKVKGEESITALELFIHQHEPIKKSYEFRVALLAAINSTLDSDHPVYAVEGNHKLSSEAEASIYIDSTKVTHLNLYINPIGSDLLSEIPIVERPNNE